MLPINWPTMMAERYREMLRTRRGRRWAGRHIRRAAAGDRCATAPAVERLEDRTLLFFHLWEITEVFSNADGTIQFIELESPANNEQFAQGQMFTTNANTFTYPNHLPSSQTADKTFLMATSGFASLPGAVTPDYVIPDNFFSVTGDTLTFVPGPDVFTFTNGQLPLDGVTSLFTDATTGANSPTNFAGMSGSIDVSPPPPPPDSFDSIVGRLTDGRVFVGVSDGTTFSNELWATFPAGVDWQDIQVGNFNGDEKEDLAARDDEGDWWVWTAGEDSFTAAEWGGRWNPNITWSNVLVGDFNGDGLDDIAGRAQSGGWYVAHSSGSDFSTTFIGAWTTNVDWMDVNVGDFNADDADDIVGRSSSGTWVILQSTDSSGNHSNLVAGTWSTNVTWHDVLVGDFDDDDHDDVIGRASNGSWYVAFSDGSGFTNVFAKAWSTNVTWHDVMLGDFNGDDRTDVAGRASNGSWYLLQPTGGSGSSTTFANVFAGAWSTNVTWLNVVAGDFTGDGRTDLAGRASNGAWYVSRAADPRFVNEFWGIWSAAVTWHDVQRINVS